MPVQVKAFLALEASLSSHLMNGWGRIAKTLLPEVWKAMESGNTGRAIELVNGIDLSPLVEKNLKSVEYLSHSAMLFGASRITDKLMDTAVAKGNHLGRVEQAVTLLSKSVVQNVEQSIRRTLLAEIATYDLADPTTNFGPSDTVLVQKVFNKNQPRDALGKWTEVGDIATHLFDDERCQKCVINPKQPFHDKDSLYEKSREAVSELKGWLDSGKGVADDLGYVTADGSIQDNKDLVERPGGVLFVAPLKSMDVAEAKVKADYKDKDHPTGDWSKLKDVIRAAIAVDTMADVQRTVDKLVASGMVLAQLPKNRFLYPAPVDYRDVLLNVQFKNGVIGELQLQVKPMLMAKEFGGGHDWYRKGQKIEQMYAAAGVPIKDLKPKEYMNKEDLSAWNVIQEEQRRLYSAAWAKVQK